MGLDVYLEWYADRDASKERERLYNARMDAVYARELSDEQLERERRAVAADVGVSEWGEDEAGSRTINEPSALDPAHLFKLGYFRSSYNPIGINNFLRRVIGVPGLYAVFSEARDVYEFQPDWEAAKQRALEIAGALHDVAQSRAHDVTAVRHSPYVAVQQLPGSEHAALELFRSQKPSLDAYSSAQGEFFLKKVLPVRALIPGTRESLGRTEPVVYAVFDAADDYRWYETALRIVAETCDFVLRQPDRERYWLRWSA